MNQAKNVFDFVIMQNMLNCSIFVSTTPTLIQYSLSKLDAMPSKDNLIYNWEAWDWAHSILYGIMLDTSEMGIFVVLEPSIWLIVMSNPMPPNFFS